MTRINNYFVLTIIFCFLVSKARSEQRTYFSAKLSTQPPQIDGRLVDKAWETGQWQSDFTQRSPYDGKKPSQKTEFKILYDDKYIYLAFKNYDTEPGEIENRMSRRDGFAGDWIEVNIDSYNDDRTAFSFTLTAAGVKGDEFISQDGSHWDSSWDPIWYGKTSINDKGWFAEMKIPLSQLRYGSKEEQTWGLQVHRRIFRLEEQNLWQYVPQEKQGWVSNFGVLKGIKGIKPQKQVEITPYILGKYETYQKDSDNPFADGKDSDFYGGLDGKIGVTSDLTLDFTINPDFGQVEADPSEVNLSGFETYFSEKRPFFIEGREILNFKITKGGSPISSDNLFYSRRIGRPPHHFPDLDDNEYAKMPANTSIIGAAKLTGKTKNGLSVGIMESVTAEEKAQIKTPDGDKRSILVEPLTNYFASRLKKDFNKGNTTFGGMVTSTNRDIDKEYLEYLHTNAYTGGLDFLHQWQDKKYYTRSNIAISHVTGTKEAITETQTSHRHYFQRPDAEHLEVDSNATSLTGHGGIIEYGKQGGGHWRYSTWITWRSPGLELNDIGYNRRTDEVMQVFWLQYRVWEPKGIFRNYQVSLDQWKGVNFDMHSLYQGCNLNFYSQFKNYWRFGMGTNAETNQYSYSALRGGPMLRQDNYFGTFFNIHSDSRKKFRVSTGGNFNKAFNDAWISRNLWMDFDLQLLNALSVSLNPWISFYENKVQYVTTLEDVAGSNEYICSSIDQETLGLSMRVNFNVTPDFTIQYYGQPFVSSVDYFDYKVITDTKAKKLNGRYYQFTPGEITYLQDDGEYQADVNHDGTLETFGDPDFNFLQFKSNLVLRWEYIPGSVLYLVWSQGRTDHPPVREFDFRKDYTGVFDVYPHDIFLIKLTYCIKA